MAEFGTVSTVISYIAHAAKLGRKPHALDLINLSCLPHPFKISKP